jgi:hypothetical protein
MDEQERTKDFNLLSSNDFLFYIFSSSTTSWLGGKNKFLGDAYVAVIITLI